MVTYFTAVDKDGDGCLDRDELADMLINSGRFPDFAEVKMLVDK